MTCAKSVKFTKNKLKTLLELENVATTYLNNIGNIIIVSSNAICNFFTLDKFVTLEK